MVGKRQRKRELMSWEGEGEGVVSLEGRRGGRSLGETKVRKEKERKGRERERELSSVIGGRGREGTTARSLNP